MDCRGGMDTVSPFFQFKFLSAAVHAMDSAGITLTRAGEHPAFFRIVIFRCGPNLFIRDVHHFIPVLLL